MVGPILTVPPEIIANLSVPRINDKTLFNRKARRETSNFSHLDLCKKDVKNWPERYA